MYFKIFIKKKKNPPPNKLKDNKLSFQIVFKNKWNKMDSE